MPQSIIISNPSRILIVFLALLTTLVQSLDIAFCSPDNTGEANGANYWKYQSNGHCQDTCKYQYAYAVIQENNCWCSNYAPFDQVDNGNCNSNCPGFPSEQCGNQAESLYGYYLLSLQPSGTFKGPGASTTQPATVSRPQPQVSATTRGTPTPVIIYSTLQGSIQTVTVTPVLPPDVPQTSTPSASASSVPAQDPFWSSTAKVAGTFTALGIVIVLLIGVIAFFLWKRHRSSDSVAIRSVSDNGDNRSESAGGVAGGVFTEKRNSRQIFGGGRGGGSNERSPGPNTPASMSRRASQPMVHDQRLNPNALYHMGQDNGSHISVASFQDDQDYTRPVLRLHNPDAD